ncbi:MAG: acylphosphatase [Wenzhouxiangella sp.]
MAERRRWLVAGKVQGVWFRASTRKEAERLGLGGHATNLEDGRVEVLAEGEAHALDQLESWLAKGPMLAKVTSLSCVEQQPIDSASENFSTG